jgi:hypothetical protein
MSILAGMNVPEKLLALVSRYALQSDAVWAMPVQVTILDAVSRGVAYYPFGLRFIFRKPAPDEECLELEDPIHSLLPCQCQKDAVMEARSPEPPALVVVAGQVEGLILSTMEKQAA